MELKFSSLKYNSRASAKHQEKFSIQMKQCRTYTVEIIIKNSNHLKFLTPWVLT